MKRNAIFIQQMFIFTLLIDINERLKLRGVNAAMTNVKKIPASVLEQLRNTANDCGRSFDSILHSYIQVRLLHRLSISTYRDRFVLKNDLLLFSLTNGLSKTNLEMDLSVRYFSNDLRMLKQAFEEICSIDAQADGVEFLVDELIATRVRGDFDTEWVNIKVPVKLHQSLQYIQIKIHLRDYFIVQPKSIAIQTLIETNPPEILTYPIEAMIAEKFEEIISYVSSSNRMKDFYDIYILSDTQNFEGRILQQAILDIFDRRRTLIEKDHPVFSTSFYLDPARQTQWQIFMEQSSSQQPLTFKEVMKRIQKMLSPIYMMILTEEEFFKNWSSEIKEWQ